MALIKRSKVRRVCGRVYYYLKRKVDWHFSGRKFAYIKGGIENFPYTIFSHQTPLIRDLAKVDMWLQYNKIINLKLAINELNNVVIFPGEIFSLWLLLGKPTRAKGYVDGMVLDNGKINAGVGGGLCQLSNLIYWMTLHTPLTVIERWRHSHDVFPDSGRNLPFGTGATCAYPFLDLQIKNTTQQPYQLYLGLDEAYLTGEWRSITPIEFHYEIYEAFHEINCDFYGQYIRHNLIRRKIFNLANIQVGDEFITENHAIMMYTPFLTG